MLSFSRRVSVYPVLRVGWIQNGKLVKEQVLDRGQSVYLSPDILLAEYGRKGYHLKLPAEVTGRLEANGQAIPVNPKTITPIPVGTKGKLVFSDQTILLQLLEPRQEAMGMNWAPSFFDRDDPLFRGLLTCTATLAGAFSLWVQLQPPVVYDAEAISEDIIEVVRILPRISIDVPAPSAPSTTPAPNEAHPTVSPRPTHGPTYTREQSADATQRWVEILKGGNAPGAGPDMEQAAKDLRGKLAGLEATNANGIPGLRQGQDLVAVPIPIPGIGPGKPVGGVVVPGVDKPTIKIPEIHPISIHPPELTSGDPAEVSTLLRAQQGRVATCVQTQLAQDPNLHGKLTLSWELETGKAGHVVIEDNSTGNKALEACFINAIKRMNFAELSGTVDSFSWVVSGK